MTDLEAEYVKFVSLDFPRNVPAPSFLHTYRSLMASIEWNDRE
jgi:hypothetical protein